MWSASILKKWKISSERNSILVLVQMLLLLTVLGTGGKIYRFTHKQWLAKRLESRLDRFLSAFESNHYMLSVRGIALLTLLLTIISLGLYMLGVPNQYFPKIWKMTNSVWSAISIVLLIIGASICFYQSVNVYKDSAHCEFGPEDEILESVINLIF